MSMLAIICSSCRCSGNVNVSKSSTFDASPPKTRAASALEAGSRPGNVYGRLLECKDRGLSGLGRFPCDDVGGIGGRFP